MVSRRGWRGKVYGRRRWLGEEVFNEEKIGLIKKSLVRRGSVVRGLVIRCCVFSSISYRFKIL